MKNWTYIFDGDTYGIVKAPTEKEAKQKVLKAYTELIIVVSLIIQMLLR